MKLILGFFLALISLGCFGQNSFDCSEVKTGKFKSSNEVSGVTIIKRTKKYQIEINKKYNYKAKFKIVWIDDCTYELREKKLIKGPNQLKGNSGDVLKVKIIWIKKGVMKVNLTSNYSESVQEVEIEIIN